MSREFLKEYFSIPNLLSYIRIVLAVIYVYLFYRAVNGGSFLPVIFIVVISAFSDFADGHIARRFGMITRWGKMLDPVADKISLGAVIVSLVFVYEQLIIVLLFYFMKEIIMGIAGLYTVKIGCKVEGAKWYGKICTTITYGVLLAMLVVPRMSGYVLESLIAVEMIAMGISLYNYLIYFERCWEEKRTEG